MVDCIPLIAAPKDGSWIAIACGRDVCIFQGYVTLTINLATDSRHTLALHGLIGGGPGVQC